MFNKTDLVLILAVLGVAVFILWKSGIFKLANTASELAGTAIEGANKIATDIVNLPENISYIAGSIPDIGKSAVTQIENATGWDLPFPSFNDDIARPTDRAINIVNSLRDLYPSLSSDLDRVKASARDGIKYDANGYPVNPQNARDYL